jgi:hypothetical protein
MDMTVYFNQYLPTCPRTSSPAPGTSGYTGAEGYCYGDVIGRDINFQDWLPPTPNTDVYVPPDVCSDLPAAILNQIETACLGIYPSNPDLYGDCKMDACSSGDPNIIPLVTPTPQCIIERIVNNTNATSCQSLGCPNVCSYHGTCDTTTYTCVCNVGFTGYDCGQPTTFGCIDVQYGTVDTYITPVLLPTLRTSFDTVNKVSSLQLQQMNKISVERSVLIYTVSYGGNYFLYVSGGSSSSPYLGSFQICFGSTPLSLNSTYPVGQNFLTTTNCYLVQYQAYSQAGLIFNLGAGPTSATYTISVSQKVNIDQVLFGSADGSSVLDVAKVPLNYQNSFTMNINSCTSSTCSLYDGDCQACASQTNCGYCLESGRCYLGNPTGPYLGVGLCNNWRFTYDSSISRVVTVEYNGMDLVDPDYEVYLLLLIILLMILFISMKVL